MMAHFLCFDYGQQGTNDDDRTELINALQRGIKSAPQRLMEKCVNSV
jgi:hypothetical protein